MLIVEPAFLRDPSSSKRAIISAAAPSICSILVRGKMSPLACNWLRTNNMLLSSSHHYDNSPVVALPNSPSSSFGFQLLPSYLLLYLHSTGTCSVTVVRLLALRVVVNGNNSKDCFARPTLLKGSEKYPYCITSPFSLSLAI